MSHRYLVLGLLSERPMTGYEIRKRVCETMSMIASPSYGAVYPILHRLLREGAVTMDVVEQEGRPAKKVYAITRSGRDDFATWLRKPAAADQVRREFLVKVLFARDLDPEELTAHLRDRQAEVEGQIAVLEAVCSEPEAQANGYHALVIDYALALYRAELCWLDRVAQAVRAGELLEDALLLGPD